MEQLLFRFVQENPEATVSFGTAAAVTSGMVWWVRINHKGMFTGVGPFLDVAAREALGKVGFRAKLADCTCPLGSKSLECVYHFSAW